MPDLYMTGLLRALDNSEKALAEADAQLNARQLEWDVAAIQFGALRDEAYGRLGGDPYRVGEWQEKRDGRGTFRYVRMNPGWAVVEVVADADEPVTAGQIRVRLRRGGLASDLRTINAVVQGSKEIELVGPAVEGKPPRYQLVVPDAGGDVEPDDLPF